MDAIEGNLSRLHGKRHDDLTYCRKARSVVYAILREEGIDTTVFRRKANVFLQTPWGFEPRPGQRPKRGAITIWENPRWDAMAWALAQILGAEPRSY